MGPGVVQADSLTCLLHNETVINFINHTRICYYDKSKCPIEATGLLFHLIKKLFLLSTICDNIRKYSNYTQNQLLYCSCCCKDYCYGSVEHQTNASSLSGGWFSTAFYEQLNSDSSQSITKKCRPLFPINVRHSTAVPSWNCLSKIVFKLKLYIPDLYCLMHISCFFVLVNLVWQKKILTTTLT